MLFSHPSTNQAEPCLASEIRRARVHSGWYGHRLPCGFNARLLTSILTGYWSYDGLSQASLFSYFSSWEFCVGHIHRKRLQFMACLLKKKKKNWLHWVLAMGCRIISCGVWDLVPRPGIEPWAPALGARSHSHWITREAPTVCLLTPLMVSFDEGALILI